MDISKLVEKAREASERRNYDYAIELYLQALRLSPDEGLARKELRQVENRVAKERGSSFMIKAKVTMQLTKAHALLTTKKYESCMETCEEALKLDPGCVSALMVLGKAAQAARFLNAAISCFEDVRASKAGGHVKTYVEASRALAMVYEGNGRIQEAMEMWSEVKRASPDDRDANQKLRDLSASEMSKNIETSTASGQRGSIARTIVRDTKELQRQERDQQSIRTADDLRMAINDVQEDLKKKPEEVRLHVKLGDLYRRGEQYAEAKACFETAAAKEPTNPQWKFRLDDLEMWKTERELAELFKKFKAGDASAREEYSRRRSKNLEFKLSSFLEREKFYSTDSKIRFDLGMTYFEMAEAKRDNSLYDEAINRFQKTFPDPKFRHESGLRMGLGFARKGQFDLALKRFEETIASLELKNEFWQNLMYAKADTLEQSGKLPEALQAFLQIYEINVAFRDVAKRVENIQKKIKGGTAA